ncbi:mechanosensitive ion channel family protein [Actibacterium sp. XHP0104]|uniref:mechanosensitive ion channel family protein n=1 Tax=Actibacterium sp. XHP0104 TaxID=2984335 RepID=UPI0021E71F26|nr:mechanosensitive ion channel domain-containing protein [Actibacterium sp. XHP0104]MCV2881717.1 mechanosensitive ion channel [Actibacterium sp. XHP0104]
MQPDTPDLMEQIAQLLARAEFFLRGLASPGWPLYQVLILFGLIVLSYLLSLVLRPRLDAWVRGKEGLSKWRLRLFVMVQQRLKLILFTLMAWPLVGVMREMMLPSRSYIIALAATLALSWLIVRLAARLIGNRTLRRVVTWGLLAYVTLFFLGLTDEAMVFLDGLAITFGDFRLSALTVLKALIITTALFVAARALTHTATTQVQQNEDISPSMRVLIVKFLQIALYSGAFFIGLKAVGFDLTGLAVLSGAIGVGLGFGLQKVVSNLVSGVIILLDKSIKPGDVISLGDTFGWIEALGARYVSVVTRDGREYLIPNEDLITGQVVNWSHSNEFVRIDLFFGTSYHDDPHLVRKVAIEAAQSVNRVLKHRPTVCHITGFGDSSVDYILRFWITDPVEGLTNVRGAVYLALWDAFQENGISIPFPQREVRVLEGSTLTTRNASE